MQRDIANLVDNEPNTSITTFNSIPLPPPFIPPSPTFNHRKPPKRKLPPTSDDNFVASSSNIPIAKRNQITVNNNNLPTNNINVSDSYDSPGSAKGNTKPLPLAKKSHITTNSKNNNFTQVQ